MIFYLNRSYVNNKPKIQDENSNFLAEFPKDVSIVSHGSLHADALCVESGLPDGFFSNQKSQFGQILEGHRLEIVDIFYGHFEYFTDIWDVL
jgi:hypothetical protein